MEVSRGAYKGLKHHRKPNVYDIKTYKYICTLMKKKFKYSNNKDGLNDLLTNHTDLGCFGHANQPKTAILAQLAQVGK